MCQVIPIEWDTHTHTHKIILLLYNNMDINDYFIVIHTDNSMESRILEHINKHYADNEYLLTYELGKDGDNPHYHMILLKAAVKKNACRERWKRALHVTVSVNEIRSQDKSLLYILKDFTIIASTIDESYIQKLIDSVRKSQLKFIKTKTKTKSFTSILVDTYIEPQDMADIVKNIGEKNAIKHCIVKHIQSQIIDNGRGIDRIIFPKYFYAIYNKHYPEDSFKVMRHWSDQLDL